jgi:hypothetical protein
VANELYYATWVSDELAGTTKPNIISYNAPDTITGEAVATAIDPHISGDLTSITQVIGGNADRSGYPDAGGGSENAMMCNAAGVCEHISFRGVHFGVIAALQGYVKDHPGKLQLFKDGSAVTFFKLASR